MKGNNEIGRIIMKWISKGKNNKGMGRLTEVKIKEEE